MKNSVWLANAQYGRVNKPYIINNTIILGICKEPFCKILRIIFNKFDNSNSAPMAGHTAYCKYPRKSLHILVSDAQKSFRI